MSKRKTLDTVRFVVLISLIVLTTPMLFAQQTGSIVGRVTSGADALPGVTIEARSNVLPQARVTTTTESGDYRLPQLVPGRYTVTFSLAGMETRTRNVDVQLDQESVVNVSLGVAGVAETITVVADQPLVDPTTPEIKSAITSEQIDELPVGQEYRDLVKLIPAVQYTEDQTRGPSAGGSGQDNVYQFDGVNVTLPQYGTLSAEPSSHDIDQISVIRGGAKAIDFNRAAGFTIDSVSKSGTNEWAGEVSYQVLPSSWVEDDREGNIEFDEDRSWATLGVGGPILADRLFIYGSYYRPERTREGVVNPYGPMPDFDSTRDELFGKLTFTPTANILLNGSYRTSDREEIGSGTSTGIRTATTSEGGDATLDVGILEGSWVINDRSFATFKFNDFENKTASRPDVLLGVDATPGAGARLDVNNLEQAGFFQVPRTIADQTAFNAFADPFIQRYGFLNDAGVRTGGGFVGAASTINDQDFFRQSAQIGYDFTIGDAITHDIHVGYQWYTDEEDLQRTSNGWGLITAPGGIQFDRRSQTYVPYLFNGQPIMFEARVQQQSLGVGGGVLHSELESQNIEINDTVHWNNWTFNAGVLFSNDVYWGQGLREDSSTVSGYVLAPGNKYKMYEIDFEDMIQPRVGATWAYNGLDSVYASWARYNPAVSSLPRAASYDRFFLVRTVGVFFDADGNFLGSTPIASSGGKLFQEDMDPRFTDEFVLGTSQQMTGRWSGRLYGRYRYSANFWEDTNNDARVNPDFDPPEDIPNELYIPNLGEQRSQIGAGSSYVIAELDGAFTKFLEATMESEWRGDRTFLRGSYTWSHYYGNFDQDNTTTVNDQAIFVGSSFIADGPGSQLWDNRYGDLRGDRRHLLKIYGSYQLPWNATTGAFGIYQSGQPWEEWSGLSVYNEPAGSRRSPDHYQLDLNYTQNFPIGGLNLQAAIDLFNITDNQTGYNYQPRNSFATFGQPRNYYDPRRYQVALRLQF